MSHLDPSPMVRRVREEDREPSPLVDIAIILACIATIAWAVWNTAGPGLGPM